MICLSQAKTKNRISRHCLSIKDRTPTTSMLIWSFASVTLTLILDLDLDILKLYVCTENQICRSRHSNARDSQKCFLVLWPWPWPMSSIYDCDLDILKMYLQIKNEVWRWRLLKVRAQTGQTHTHTHRQT